jgi:anthranilate phosphoribosyltransferase
VHGAGGLDEISTLGHTKVSELVHGTVNTFYVHPSDVGLPTCGVRRLRAGRLRRMRQMVEQLLAGERGPRRDIVLLNAGLLLCSSPARRRHCRTVCDVRPTASTRTRPLGAGQAA